MQKHLKEESRLWDYTILQKLGKGASGEVFRVINKCDKQLYALKKMPIANTQQKQKLQAFKQIKCLNLLNHPSIIEYKQSFLSMDNIYIVMEYAQKGDLLKTIEDRKRKQRPFQEDELWSMFGDLIKGVKYLHEKNIIHRDLKLENIFLTACDKLKIGDLGMAKIIPQDNLLISTRVGTPIYFAPEMIKNQLYSFSVDVWALGCVFYSLAALQHPFQEASLQTLGYYVVDKDPKPIKGQYSVQLINFINCCLDKDSSSRPTIFQLAIKVKNKNRSQIQFCNKISIFDLKHLNKILAADSQTKRQRKIMKGFNLLEKGSSYLNIPLSSPRKIYTSLNERRRAQSRKTGSSVGQRDFNVAQRDLRSNSFIIESPQSPRKGSKQSAKPMTYRPKKVLYENMEGHCYSPLIKSKGFSLLVERKSCAQLNSDFVEKKVDLEFSPQKTVSFKKSFSRRSHR